MAKVILGKVAISWKGVHSSSTPYSAQDVVSYNNQCYICTTDGTSGTFNPNFWELFTNSPINFTSNEFDLIFKDQTGNLSTLPLGPDDSVLGIDYYTKSPIWQKLQFQLGSRIQRFAISSGHDAIESTCFAIDTNDRLRAWGDGSNYALGVGSAGTNEMIPVSVAFPQNFSGISKLYTSNSSYQGAIDNDGKWWVWGSAASLGSNQGSPGSNISTDLFTPVCISDDSSNSIYGRTIVSSVEKFETSTDFYSNILLDSAGDVHFVGYSNPSMFGISRTTYVNYTLSSLIPSAVQIASSGFHENATYYSLDASGNVYSFGHNDNSVGQRGESSPSNSLATSLTISKPVVKIYGALGQGMAIDEDGGLWIWGNNSNGQSGIYNTTNQSVPMLVSDFPGTTSSNKVKDVYFNTGSQYRVTIIVTETNDVYCAGNDFANTSNTPQFVALPIPSGEVVTHVACVGGNGSTNTITALFLTSTNKLFVIGYGNYGQLGDGLQQSSSSLQELIHIGSNVKIIDIHGFGHNENSGFCLLEENGRLFYMGSGMNMKSADDDSFHKFTLQEIVF